MKIFVSDSHISYSHHQVDWLRSVTDVEVVRHIEDAEVVVFTGGEDISPEIYGENVGNRTWFNDARDLIEINDFKRAQELGLVCLGICRGAQLLCALSGGKIIQHTTNHAGAPHYITFKDGSKVMSNSLHHQMLWLNNLNKEDYDLLAWSSDNRSTTYLNGDDEEIELPEGFVEPEIVWFPKTKCFGVQGHPEMAGMNSLFSKTVSEAFLNCLNSIK